jgi:hypothetical protein
MEASISGAVKPISPSQVADQRSRVIPSVVIEIFNRHIAKRFDGEQALVLQDSVVSDIEDALGIGRHEVFAQHYLDVEPLFAREGWEVKYSKPAYNETFAAHFIFSVPGK